LTARYDAAEHLREAVARWQSKSEVSTATVTVTDGKARVERKGRAAATFDCPAGIIVTSAPDWTDAVVAVKRYDPAGKPTQEFAGLWIHPTQEPARLAFKLTRQGEDEIKHEDRTLRLLRLTLELRGGSKYVVWRNETGELVRLIPEGKPGQGIVLAGWEERVRALPK
jgi:hypothetical protein